MQSLVVNRALVDNDKRLGWVATKTFLRMNGHAAPTTDADAAYELVIEIASGEMEEPGAIAGHLRRLLGDPAEPV